MNLKTWSPLPTSRSIKKLLNLAAAAVLLASALINSTFAQTPAPYVVQFASDAFEFTEGSYFEASIPFDMQLRYVPPAGSVRLSITGGTATRGFDFHVLNGSSNNSLAWEFLTVHSDGTTVVGLRLSVTDDHTQEPDETIELTLSDPGPDVVLGPRTRTIVTIRNRPPTFEVFGFANASEAFGGTVTQVIVNRLGDREPAVSVDLRVDEADPPASRDLPAATRNADFMPVNQRLHFASGELSKVVEVQILDDGELEGDEFVTAVLSQPSSGAVLPTPTAVFRIIDNEVPTHLARATISPWPAPFAAIESGSHRLYPQSDGGVLVVGNLFTVNGVKLPESFEIPHIVKLSSDGEIDESFHPPEPSRFEEFMAALENSFVPDRASYPSLESYSCSRFDRFRPNAACIPGLDDLVKPQIVSASHGLSVFRGSVISVNGVPVNFGLGGPSGHFLHLALTNLPRTALQISGELLRERVGIFGFGAFPFFITPEPAAPDTDTFPLTFRRLGATAGSASLRYTTRDGTAVAGKDYVAVSGTITFAPLEVEKAVSITVLADAEEEFDETFEVVVIEAEGFEVLPPPMVLTIQDPSGRGPRPRLDRVKRLRDGRVLISAGELQRQDNGAFQPLPIEFSSDLKSWRPLTNLFPGVSLDRNPVWLDASATNAPTRYYRATTQ